MVNRYALPGDPHKVRGEKHHNAKLTEAAVREIRRAYDAGEAVRAIACRHRVNPATVLDIGHRRTWKHI